MSITFVLTIIASLILMGLMIIRQNDSIEILAGSIVAIISSFVTMVVSIYQLPKIIAEYLFNKQEDEQMGKIIGNIQAYELKADKTEQMREKASVDAAMSSLISYSDSDSEMADSQYIDPSSSENDGAENEAKAEEITASNK